MRCINRLSLRRVLDAMPIIRAAASATKIEPVNALSSSALSKVLWHITASCTRLFITTDATSTTLRATEASRILPRQLIAPKLGRDKSGNNRCQRIEHWPKKSLTIFAFNHWTKGRKSQVITKRQTSYPNDGT